MTELRLSPEEIAALRKRERATDTANLSFQCCPFCAFPDTGDPRSTGPEDK